MNIPLSVPSAARVKRAVLAWAFVLSSFFGLTSLSSAQASGGPAPAAPAETSAEPERAGRNSKDDKDDDKGDDDSKAGGGAPARSKPGKWGG